MQVQILTGDALEQLRTLPDESVHCCVTSPPYWGLRDYGTGDAQIGLEDTPDAYVGRLVAVFDEVRRVLRADGTLWLNLGDSYVANRGNTPENPGYDNKAAAGHAGLAIFRGRKDTAGLKPKDLVGIPWRVAFALQSAGWWLRSDIIWAKPNPMPESVTDRPTKAHEYVFLLAKSERYFYDAEAVREPAKEWSGRAATFARDGDVSNHVIPGQSAAVHRSDRSDVVNTSSGRNRRSVWQIATRPYPEAHFAVYPPALVEPCILAGTSARGVCPACGAPWVRVVEREAATYNDQEGVAQRLRNQGASNGGTRKVTPSVTDQVRRNTTGWEPSCSCDAGDPIPPTVLDPFAGSGTTLAVAIEHKRAAIGIELNPAYVTLIEKRLAGVQPTLFPLTI